MSRIEKSFLLFCEDKALAESISAPLKTKVKSLVIVASADEALSKCQNQVFDGFLIRTQKASLQDKDSLFQWGINRKELKNSFWVVLGKDIENQDVLINNKQVKFTDQYTKPDEFYNFLKTIFYNPNQSSSNEAIDVNFINPIVGAVVDILKTMGQLELKRGTPFLKKPTDAASAQGDISGIIAMNSSRFIGSLAICFQDSVMFSVYKAMLGSETNSINDDVKDAVAELTNIIFGNAKRDLNVLGHNIAPAIPSVITGKNHEIRHSVKGHCICIPFESTAGKVVVEYVIAPTQGT